MYVTHTNAHRSQSLLSEMQASLRLLFLVSEADTDVPSTRGGGQEEVEVKICFQ